MEIEARFAIPDQTTYDRLRSLATLDRFTVQGGEVIHIEDVYLDTEDRRIARAGCACCLRREGTRHTVLLKKRESPDPPVHRYERLQADVPGDMPWSQWPAGPVQEGVAALIGQEDLMAVLALNRTQEKHRICIDDRIVAEFRQDVVKQTVDDEQQEFLDLVIHLNRDGTEDDLAALIESVRRSFDLLPQPVSRYQRGVAVGGRPPTESPLLTREEYRLLKGIAHQKKRYARRACALIALHHGATQVEAGAYAGLTDRRVRHWLAEFREKRLAIFPKVLLDAEATTGISVALQGEGSDADAVLEPVKSLAPPSSGPTPDDSGGPGLEPDDTMTEAARKTLQYQLAQMLAHEEQTRASGDPEELHKMRVATRRMRAAVRVFGPYVKTKALKPYLNVLRQTAKALGQVRDLDVAVEKAQDYTQSDAGRSANLTPVLEAWRTAHELARAQLLAYLGRDSYARFKVSFGDFLSNPLPKPKRLTRNDKIKPQLVRHVVPIEIYRRLAAVRAYDATVTQADVSLEDYHNLRIATKRLRYTLEFFEEVLGPEGREAIDALKRLQDYLGDLQDAVVASDRLRNFWLWGTWDPPAPSELLSTRVRPILAPGVARYHAEKQIEIQEALDDFVKVWQQFRGAAFGELVAKAVSVL